VGVGEPFVGRRLVLTNKEITMTFPINAATRSPKGDHNRRLALGIEADAFAREAGVTTEALRTYETTGPDHDFDVHVADLVGAALDRLEANPPESQSVVT
jgi:hypothetical protein